MSLAAPRLTEKQWAFVKNVVSGMNYTASARQAGYAMPNTQSYQLITNPNIQEGIEFERRKYEHASNMSRKKVVDGMLEAVDIARTMSEPASMVAGWREIGKLLGYYAPETKTVNLSVNGAVTLQQIGELTDEELAHAILEGESVRLTDEEGEVIDSLEEQPQAALSHSQET